MSIIKDLRNVGPLQGTFYRNRLWRATVETPDGVKFLTMIVEGEQTPAQVHALMEAQLSKRSTPWKRPNDPHQPQT